MVDVGDEWSKYDIVVDGCCRLYVSKGGSDGDVNEKYISGEGGGGGGGDGKWDYVDNNTKWKTLRTNELGDKDI